MTSPDATDTNRSAGTVAARERAAWMSVLARATRQELEEAWANRYRGETYNWVRRPEIGLVMVQGRAGGTGIPFNLGEMTVTRCTLALAGGTIGFACIAGRDLRHAELAALFDGLLQDRRRRASLMASLIDPLRMSQIRRRASKSRKAAATKVDFFTMSRGENQS